MKLNLLHRIISRLAIVLENDAKYQFITNIIFFAPLIVFFILVNSSYKMPIIYISISSLVMLMTLLFASDEFITERIIQKPYRNDDFIIYIGSTLLVIVWIMIIKFFPSTDNKINSLLVKLLILHHLLFSIFSIVKLSKFTFELSISKFIKGYEVFDMGVKNEKYQIKVQSFIEENKDTLLKTFQLKKAISLVVIIFFIFGDAYFFNSIDLNIFRLNNYINFNIIEFELSFKGILFLIIWFFLIFGWYSSMYLSYSFISLITDTDLYGFYKK